MSAPVLLPSRIDLSCVGRLAADIRDAADETLTIDASGVSVLGGLGLQVLLAAAAERRALGRGLAIAAPSAAFQEALAQFGVTADDITTGVPS